MRKVQIIFEKLVIALLQSGAKPKNARLLEAILQNQDAKIRTQIWLVNVVEEVYAEVEARHKRTEKAFLLLRGATMPEIVFAYFHQKFGSKALVDEYIGSLNNTMLHYLKVSFMQKLSIKSLHRFHSLISLLDTCSLAGR